VTVIVQNPFLLALTNENLRVLTDSVTTTCKPSTKLLTASGITTMHLHVIPTEINPIAVLGIEFSVCGASQTLRIPEPIEVLVVDNVPRYDLRTDLPLYDGEIHEFRFWITNSGDFRITDIQVRFEQPELTELLSEPKLPLLPGCQLSIKCAFTADKSEDLISLTLVSSCDLSVPLK
jgi:hypothetical protein